MQHSPLSSLPIVSGVTLHASCMHILTDCREYGHLYDLNLEVYTPIDFNFHLFKAIFLNTVPVRVWLQIRGEKQLKAKLFISVLKGHIFVPFFIYTLRYIYICYAYHTLLKFIYIITSIGQFDTNSVKFDWSIKQP